MKRKLALLLVIAVGGFALLTWWSYTAPGINKRTADRIYPGMTVKAVEDLIGKPPGNYTTSLIEPKAQWIVVDNRMRWNIFSEDRHSLFWFCDTGYIGVVTDENDRVVSSTYTALEDPIWSRVRRWLGLDPRRTTVFLTR